jgi:hypothetical protein
MANDKAGHLDNSNPGMNIEFYAELHVPVQSNSYKFKAFDY